jgi:prolyl-tRNA synthetase
MTEGIEVGHIFKLGTKYSEAMQAVFQDGEGKEKPFVMGCYGIGVSRVVAAAIEQNHDDNGIIFPIPLAPYKAVVVNLGVRDENLTAAAEQLYDALVAKGLDTLYDDRDERPGSKFKDADLLGIPFRITVGKRFTADGVVEVRRRSDGMTEEMGLDAVTAFIEQQVHEATS